MACLRAERAASRPPRPQAAKPTRRQRRAKAKTPEGGCFACGGPVVEKNGQKPPLTGVGRVQCWACADGSSERVEPKATGARCKDCQAKLPPGRRCGRCPSCQKEHRRRSRRQYMRAYRSEPKQLVLA